MYNSFLISFQYLYSILNQDWNSFSRFPCCTILDFRETRLFCIYFESWFSTVDKTRPCVNTPETWCRSIYTVLNNWYEVRPCQERKLFNYSYFILFRQSVLKGLEEVQKTAKIDPGLPDSPTYWSRNIK